jgi:hypothetical protein
MLLVNPIVTAMISFKIFFSVRRTQRNPNLSTGNSLNSIFAILVESAAPWTVLGIVLTIVDWLDLNGARGGWQVCLYLVWCAVGVSNSMYLLELQLTKC